MRTANNVKSFGNSIERAYKTGIKPIEIAIKKEFTNYNVVNAYTSNIIRKKIKERDGIDIPNVLEALEGLKNQGYERIIVQPTHIIPGHEYDKVKSLVSKFKHRNKDTNVILGKPMLYTGEDFRNITKIFEGEISNLEENEGLVLMGHGTDHFANSAYFRLIYDMKEISKNVFMTLVEDEPSFETIIDKIKNTGIKNVKVKPFMIVAGDHAVKDMASEDDDSLLTMLTNVDVKCNCILEGLGSYSDVASIFVNKIKDIIDMESNMSKLNRFMDDKGMITNWPSKKTMKLEVLKYIAEKFEEETDYTEKEVNQTIDKWHTFGDYFLLRRGMIEYKLLGRTRDGAKYWKIK